MAENFENEEQQVGAARTVEVYHIEEAVRQAQMARAQLLIRLPLRGQGVEAINPAGPAGAETQGGTPVITGEPQDTSER